jgi:tubulin polyglutamylase TTLL1
VNVSDDLQEIKMMVSSPVSEYGAPRTHIIQKYIENPLLIRNRKFDIRSFVLITGFNGNLQAYYYNEGYLRTSSQEFNLTRLRNRYIHLTNDAI